MVRLSVAALALALACAACTSTRRIEDSVSREQLNPLLSLPQDAPLYLRVSLGEWREARRSIAGVDGLRRKPWNEGEGPDLLSPALLLALEPLLANGPASAGLDPARPVFFSFGSAQSEKLERIVSLGGLVEEGDLPLGLHTVALFPAADAGALTVRLETWWKEAVGARPLVHRVETLPGWVRLDLFGGRASVEEQQRHAALAQARAAPAARQLRLTPALATFVTGRADLALYMPLDRARPAAATSGALQLIEAAQNVAPPDVDTIVVWGSTELAEQWMLLDPSSAEVEDLVLLADYRQDSNATTVDVLTTLTESGREIASEEASTPLSLPRFADGPAWLELKMGGGYGANASKVAPPRAAQLMTKGRFEEPIDQVARLFKISEPWGYLSLLQSPQSWLRYAQVLSSDMNAMPLPVAVSGRLLSMTREELLDRHSPRGAIVLAFATAKEADEFLVQVRRKTEDAGELVAQRLPSKEGSLSYAFVGMGLSPEQALAGGGAVETIRTGMSLKVDPEFTRLLSRRMPGAMGPTVAGSPIQFEAETVGTIRRARLILGTASHQAVKAEAVPVFEAISREDESDPCRFQLAATMTKAITTASYANAADRPALLRDALSDFESAAARCGSKDPALVRDAKLVRDRVIAVSERNVSEVTP